MASSSRQSLHPAKKKTSLGELVSVQPYRFEPRRRSNNGDEESDASELTLRYNTRIKDVSLPGRFAEHSDRCTSQNYDTIRYHTFTCAQKLTKKTS